jgi:autoinducer 2 (AI-2) kinase
VVAVTREPLHREGNVPGDAVVVVVDAGTGSARALAFDLTGTVVARASREWTHPAVPGHPGGTAFDTAGGWTAIATVLAEVVRALGARPVLAVSASSMREGFVLYDAEGEEIWACPNTDGRARSQAERLVADGTADRIYATGGDWVSITAPARIRWLAEERPELLAAARHLGMLSDWVTYRLTGEFTTDPTCGSSSALFDVSRRCWSEELAELVGIDPRILPPVLECGTIAGSVTSEASAATGLPVGTPVVVGGADTQLALHGIGAVCGTPTVVGGTFWQTTAITRSALIDPSRRLRTLCHVEPDTWMIEGIGFLSGLAMRWFRDAFCPDAIVEAHSSGVSGFDVMERWAASIPIGSYGLVAVLADVMQADAWHHAAPALVGFDINDSERYHRGTVVRAIEEAAAFVARAHLEILDDVTGGEARSSGRLVFTGGSSAGELWPRIMAGVTGFDVVVSSHPEATSYGAARLAASGVGVVLPAAPCVEDVHHAEDGDVAAYTESFEQWRAVYRAQLDATDASGKTPLFTPPGGLPRVTSSTNPLRALDAAPGHHPTPDHPDHPDQPGHRPPPPTLSKEYIHG